MPIISTFFGIIIRRYFGDHNPPHFHVEFQGEKATFDFNGQLCWNYFRRDIPETGSLVREYSNRQSTFDQ
jgi:Domain of unknown function (DUF4160)